MISPDVYQIVVIKVGLRAYAKHKLRVNRMYTPKRMLEMAGHLCGCKFKPRAYEEAALALEKLQHRMNAERNAARSIEVAKHS